MCNQNSTFDVRKYGQSIWLDNLSRDILESGTLTKLINEFGVLGITTNPTIFEKAISGSALYDEAIQQLGHLPVNEIYEQLAIKDVRQAADILLPVYETSQGIDGYVSLEVSPNLAYDADSTLSEATRLFETINRPNIMIKIPGTREALPAIEAALFRGININVTLLFSVENYLDVAKCYIRALERRLDAGLSVSNIASVASFFISRIDTAVDKQLLPQHPLMGKIAIANAKIAYKRFKELFYGSAAFGGPFKRLRQAGARVQRPLWASTGTKNPAYSDVLYVDNLIGPETVTTLPTEVLYAFRDHGTAVPTLENELYAAEEDLSDLARVGIDLSQITSKLQQEGLVAFSKSFENLLTQVAIKAGVLQEAAKP